VTTYAIGDVQGCYQALMRLVDKINFDPDRDQLWFCGDLVNRGGESLAVLRWIKGLGNAAVCVLGNHDLHLIAQWYYKPYERKPNVEFDEIFDAPDAEALIDWLRYRPVLHADQDLNYLMVHAGLAPDWDLDTALACAEELEQFMRSDQCALFYKTMYGNDPACWQPDQTGLIRLRTITNTLTRMRFCDRHGNMDFKNKGAPGSQSSEIIPWFEALKNNWPMKIIFGHWSTLGYHKTTQTICLDTGCVWGGPLSALALEPEPRLIQVDGIID